MRLFKLQLSALLTVMMVVVMSSAPVKDSKDKRKLLMKEICTEAKHLLLKDKDNIKNYTVPKIFHGQCMNDTFCLAEKALDHITLCNKCNKLEKPDLKKFNKLKRQLIQYNNQIGITNCSINTHPKYSMEEFLENVETCAQQAYNCIK